MQKDYIAIDTFEYKLKFFKEDLEEHSKLITGFL